jgi:dTDP-4-amino-4,6-dideoxygalactose transaminase
VKALSAEGIPGVGTYPHPLYENKVFQKYKNRRTECPEAERMCKDSFWVSHEIMLAEQKDLDDFLSALSKVAANSAELISSVAV